MNNSVGRREGVAASRYSLVKAIIGRAVVVQAAAAAAGVQWIATRGGGETATAVPYARVGIV
eukprot:COSAG06_NODE_11748_length_1470_cov_1.100656_2_plen_62_part_00